MSRDILGARDLDEMLDRVVRRACLTCHCERASILLVDPERGDLYFRNANVAYGLIESVRVPLTEQSIAGWAVLHGETLVVNDATRDPRHYGRVDELVGFRTRSVLAVPFRRQGLVTGVLELLNKRGPTGFSERDVDVAESLAEETAYGVEIHHQLGGFRDFFLHMVELLSETVERQLPGHEGHHLRVADLCSELARVSGLDDETRHGLWLAALLHDVGKIRMPVSEWTSDRELHPRLGADVLARTPLLSSAAPLVASHHLAGAPPGPPEQVAAARILQVAERFDEEWLEGSWSSFSEYLSWFQRSSGPLEDEPPRRALLDVARSPRGLALYGGSKLEQVGVGR